MPKREASARIALGGPGLPSSGIWRLFTGVTELVWGPKSDVYVARRETADFVKASLHASGDWRLAFHGQPSKAASLGLPPDLFTTRVIRSWRRPAPVIQGCTLALRVIVPASELRMREPIGKSVLWGSAPPQGHYAELLIWLCPPSLPEASWPGLAYGALLLMRANLETEIMLVCQRTFPMTEAISAGLTNAHAENAAIGLYAAGHTGGYLWFRDPQDDGSFAIVEISAPDR
jgi:hypothetical protein